MSWLTIGLIVLLVYSWTICASTYCVIRSRRADVDLLDWLLAFLFWPFILPLQLRIEWKLSNFYKQFP